MRYDGLVKIRGDVRVTNQLDRLVDEIVEKVRDRLLAQGLKLPQLDIRNSIAQILPSSEKLQSMAKSDTAPLALDPQNLAAMIDHTLLKPEATESDVRKLCEEARSYKFATVCVNSSFVAKAAEFLKGSGVKAIAVVGFPLGAATTSAKAFEAREAIKDGAQEIDMVINVGELKSQNYAFVLDDIRAVVEASKPYPVKVILETSLLDHEQKTIACALSKAAGAAFVKTSTGFSTGGATTEDIALMRKIVGPAMGVKASGGIRTLEDAEKMIKAGASRIGASASVAIVKAAKGEKTSSEPSKGKKPFTGLPYKAGAADTTGTTEKKSPKGGNNNGSGGSKGGY